MGDYGLLLTSKPIARIVQVIPLHLDELFGVVLFSHSLHAIGPISSVWISAIPFHPPLIGHRVVRRLVITINVVYCNYYIPAAGEVVF